MGPHLRDTLQAMSALTDLSLTQASAQLDAGQVSAVELTRAALARIEARNPALNAFWCVAGDSALAAAAASDARIAKGERHGPLDGIPVAVKDSIAVSGLPWTAGMATRRELIADADAFVVQRLRKHGAVILGKTALNEAVLGADGSNPHYGNCQHPLRAGFTPGGSSAGSSVAVASGMAIVALGTDGLGSVRIPASYCGIAGFKPSAARVSQRGLVLASRRLETVGPLARKVADLHALYHVIAALDPLDPQSRSVPLLHLETDVVRIGYLPASQLPGLQPEVQQVYEQTLQCLGKEFELLPVEFPELVSAPRRRAGLLVCEAEMAHQHGAALAAQPQLLSPALRQMLEFPWRKSAVDLAAAQFELDQAILPLRALFRQIDVLLTPTTPQTAFAFAEHPPTTQADYTALASFCGTPALSLPCGMSAEGLPIGLQMMGPVGSDLRLLMLGERLEEILVRA